jgi:hypothetical protein
MKNKKIYIKFHCFDEFPMSELKKINEAMLNLGYSGFVVEENGNIVYQKLINE